MYCFSIFFKKCNKPCVNFSGLDENHKLLGNFEKISKVFVENSIEKLNFKLFLKFFLLAFGNNIIFLLQFFPFRGDFPLSLPWQRLCCAARALPGQDRAVLEGVDKKLVYDKI